MIIQPHVLAEMEATTPPTEVVQQRVTEYLALTQLTIKELATRIHRGANSISMFLNGKYISGGISLTDVRLRRALVDFMDAHPVGLDTAPEGVLYETSNVAVMRKWFESCLNNREMAVVYGPPGAQKSFVLQHLIAQHNVRELPKNGHGTRAYYVDCPEGTTANEILQLMCRAAAIPVRGTKLRLIDSLSHQLRERKVLFVLDEAQHLGISALEMVRRVNDRDPRCGILLGGSHGLMRMFQQRAAELEQWNSRLTNAVALPGITVPEAETIIRSELGMIEPKRLKQLIEQSRATDVFADKKQQGYLSARRLFRQLARIQQDPRFTRPDAGVSGEKAGQA